MTKFIAILIGMGALATSAVAMGDTFADMDTNGDGLLTIEEMQAAYPELTAEQFSELDTSGDGALDEAELVAGQESGLIPASTDG